MTETEARELLNEQGQYWEWSWGNGRILSSSRHLFLGQGLKREAPCGRRYPWGRTLLRRSRSPKNCQGCMAKLQRRSLEEIQWALEG